MTDLMQHIPVGSQNAKPYRAIWKSFGMYGPTYVSRQLHEMAEAGLVKRRKQQLRCSNNFAWLYWREA